MARRINPEKAMRNAHPFDVWKTLMRLKVMGKLAGKEDEFHRSADIAAKMYDNWSELELRTKLLVLDCKIGYPLRFLKSHHYIEEQVENHPTYYQPKLLDAYRANSFCSNPGFEPGWNDAIVRGIMDDKWGFWIGRRPLKISVDLD
jgi:hypothetical protein